APFAAERKARVHTTSESTALPRQRAEQGLLGCPPVLRRAARPHTTTTEKRRLGEQVSVPFLALQAQTATVANTPIPVLPGQSWQPAGTPGATAESATHSNRQIRPPAPSQWVDAAFAGARKARAHTPSESTALPRQRADRGLLGCPPGLRLAAKPHTT